jgi:hypothetical protein
LIFGSSTVNSYTLRVTTGVPSIPQGGLYLDQPECAAGAVVGFRVYAQTVPQGDPAPVDRTRDDGNPATGWELAPGGEGPFAIGSQATVTFTCHTVRDAYMATSLVFDGGFEVPYVSRNSTQILCGYCGTDDDLDGGCGTWPEGHAGPDCDDADPTVWGPPGEVRNALMSGDPDTLLWTPPLDPGASAPAYDTLRSTSAATFAAATCIETNGSNWSTVDAEDPPPGSVAHYLVRAKTKCGEGPLGAASSGVPRTAPSCP